MNEPSAPPPRRTIALACAALAAAAVAAYAGSFGSPFLYDDVGSVLENSTIRHLWPPWAAFLPPSNGYTVAGRPVLNFSLAVNYALGGTAPWGYHALNLLIHILAALTLFGILRHTIGRWSGSPRDAGSIRNSGGPESVSGRAAPPVLVPFCAALLWELHPLQTESVTYVIQRAESLMGLFFLLSLYCFIRYAESLAIGIFTGRSGGSEETPSNPFLQEDGKEREEHLQSQPRHSLQSLLRKHWFGRFDPSPSLRPSCKNGLLFLVLSVTCCLLAVGTKEVAVTIPVVVFLYDRTFISGSFREAWRRHRRMHLALAATWVPLAVLVYQTGGRAGTAGFSAGVPWWGYALTQFRGVATYLRLSIWPHPLVADYGRMLGGPPLEVACDAVVVIALLALTIRALAAASQGWRALGFAGAWFFVILAPSSSVVPVATEIIAEHRMYLPLAAVVAAIVCGARQLLHRRGAFEAIVARSGTRLRCASPRQGSGTLRSRAGLRGPWVLRVPCVLCLAAAPALGIATHRRNAVYRSNLAFWTDAVRKVPENAGAHNNLGNVHAEAGDLDAAMEEYRVALSIVPGYADAHADLGNALVKEGRYAEAVDNYLATLKVRPRDAAVRNALGTAYLRSGRNEEAAAQFREAVGLEPGRADAWSNLAELDVAGGRWADAADAYAAAVRLRPSDADVMVDYANVLAELGRRAEAMREYQAALQLQPEAADLHNDLGTLLAESGRFAEARAEFQEALRLKPDYSQARDNLDHVDRLERAASGP